MVWGENEAYQTLPETTMTTAYVIIKAFIFSAHYMLGTGLSALQR